MTKSYIKKAVSKFVKENSFWKLVDENNWYVGITKDPKVRKSAHGNPRIWRSWKANSVKEARDLEKIFLAKGMNGDKGGGTTPNYLYVYKSSGPFS